MTKRAWALYGGGWGAESWVLYGPRDFSGLEPMLCNASYWRVPIPNDWNAEW